MGRPKMMRTELLSLRNFQSSGGLRHTSTCTNYNKILEMVEKEIISLPGGARKCFPEEVRLGHESVLELYQKGERRLSRNGDSTVQRLGCMEDLGWPWERGVVLCGWSTVCVAFMVGRTGLGSGVQGFGGQAEELDSILTASVTCRIFPSSPCLLSPAQSSSCLDTTEAC